MRVQEHLRRAAREKDSHRILREIPTARVRGALVLPFDAELAFGDLVWLRWQGRAAGRDELLCHLRAREKRLANRNERVGEQLVGQLDWSKNPSRFDLFVVPIERRWHFLAKKGPGVGEARRYA